MFIVLLGQAAHGKNRNVQAGSEHLFLDGVTTKREMPSTQKVSALS